MRQASFSLRGVHFFEARSHYVAFGPETVTEFKLTGDGAPDIKSRKIYALLAQPLATVSEPITLAIPKPAAKVPNLIDL